MKRVPFWVIDTNVLVSALLSPSGPCAEILSAVRLGHVRLAWTPTILSEYSEVLQRPKFGFPHPMVANMVSMFPMDWLVFPSVRPPSLPDRDDEIFLAAALATADKILVTGNTKHFPATKRAGAVILTPREALSRLNSH